MESVELTVSVERGEEGWGVGAGGRERSRGWGVGEGVRWGVGEGVRGVRDVGEGG